MVVSWHAALCANQVSDKLFSLYADADNGLVYDCLMIL